ncbi:MAG: heavy metal translocating P-type ATPase [Chitinophagaceae bacterium]
MKSAKLQLHLPAPVLLSLALLLTGLILDYFVHPAFFTGVVRIIWYGIAYIPVGYPVAKQGFTLLLKGDVFTEFVLMTIATLGAFLIGEYPEGVAVMLFYTIGELFQDAAVHRAKRSIQALLDIRPETAMLQTARGFETVDPKNIVVGDIIQVKAGERVPLDAAMQSEDALFNAAALTGESKPVRVTTGGQVLAGMIVLDKVVELKVSKLYKDSALARILSLVQEATGRKAKTEQFIRKFSRIYTPIVVLLALCITVLPWLLVQDYVFRDWLYRALIFLVISCPCALVISIPLGYFGGIGAASANGILFKGSNFLDLLTEVNTIVMDKTGTLTEGTFTVREAKSFAQAPENWLAMAAALEASSTHPVAQAVSVYAGDQAKDLTIADIQEIGGKGLKGIVDGQEVSAGNLKLMEQMQIAVPEELRRISDTFVAVAVNGKVAGYFTIADKVKADAGPTVATLQQNGIRVVMLSGDRQAVVDKVALELGITEAFGDLLPEDKVSRLEAIKAKPGTLCAFVGDGINDAPVLALSDVGIAMGALGSDAAIETADVIIQTDQPSRIIGAIKIGKATKRVVWQNIIFAFAVKAAVLVLGAAGVATMWEAVFADVGVALLAIVNSGRIQHMKFA